MLIVKNPYENLWEKHLSVDEMDMILETRNMEGKDATIHKSVLFSGEPTVSEPKYNEPIPG